MWTYILRRLLYAIPILFGVLLITFIIFFAVVEPITLARMRLGDKAPQDQVAKWLIDNHFADYNQHGRDKLAAMRSAREAQTQATTAPQTDATTPVNDPHASVITIKDIDIYGKPLLFMHYLNDLVHLRMGKTNEKREVIDVLASGIGPSLKLMIPAFIVTECLAIFLALFAALYRSSPVDRGIVILAVLLMSFSPVAMILFAQKFFAADWGYFPISGYATGLAGIAYILLPMSIYVVARLGEETRFNRILILDEISQDYVRTARAKGLGQNAILFRHVLRNVMIPLLTRWSYTIPFLFLGSLLLESFFGIPGLGGITINAAVNTDIFMLRALVVIGTLLYIFGSLIADIMYSVVDPRVRLS